MWTVPSRCGCCRDPAGPPLARRRSGGARRRRPASAAARAGGRAAVRKLRGHPGERGARGRAVRRSAVRTDAGASADSWATPARGSPICSRRRARRPASAGDAVAFVPMRDWRIAARRCGSGARPGRAPVHRRHRRGRRRPRVGGGVARAGRGVGPSRRTRLLVSAGRAPSEHPVRAPGSAIETERGDAVPAAGAGRREQGREHCGGNASGRGIGASGRRRGTTCSLVTGGTCRASSRCSTGSTITRWRAGAGSPCPSCGISSTPAERRISPIRGRDAGPVASAALNAAGGSTYRQVRPRAPTRVRLAAPDPSAPSLRESVKYGG